MKKGITALLLALLMTITTLLGCTAAFASTADTSIEGEITFWTAWAGDAGVDDWIAQFNEIYPNVKVTAVQYANNPEGNLKLNASLLAGDAVDVVLNYTYGNYMTRVSSDLFLDVTDLVARDGINLIDEWGIDTTTDGRILGLPTGGNTDKIYINKKMFADAGIEIPETWTMDEYIEIARKLTHGEGASKVYGSSDMHSGQIYWSRYARGVLGSNFYYKEDGTSNFDHPAFAESLQMKYDLEEVEGIQMPYLDYKASGMQAPDAFMNGQVAMTVCTGMIARWIRSTDLYPRDFEVAVLPMPLMSGDGENYNDGIYYFSYLGIGSKTKYQEAAWAFSKWFATEGSKNLAIVGHVPLWKSSDKSAIIEIMFGQDAASVIDVASVEKHFLNFEGATYLDTIQTAYAEVDNITKVEMEYVMTGEKTVEDALASMKEQADAAIAAAQ